MHPLPTLTEAAARIAQRQLDPLDLLERCLEQIARFDEQVRAWVIVNKEGARREAETLAAEARRGQLRGPLHGLPIGIKDIIDVAGWPTRAGSPLWEDRAPAEQDAPIVAGLRSAGAIILGKTVTVEFACFDPSPTRNPWNLDHSPGGSSSGSAAAVALGTYPGAVGTQTGGSLVRPATYCGIATLKPTYGTLSTDGVVPVSYHLDHPGPMARCVDDLALMFRCMAGIAGEAPATPPGSGAATGPPKLGLVAQFFMDEADPPVRGITEAALARLSEAGAEIAPVSFRGGFEQVRAMHRRLMAVEAAAYHRAQFAGHRARYGPLIRGLLDEGLKIPAVDYADALAWQRDFAPQVEVLLDGVDALVMPATDTPSPPLSENTTGTPKFQAPWSCAGLPVVSIPCGLTPEGLPAALQLVAPRGGDARLLQIAAWCQRQIGFDAAPPILAG
jgi:Asp-tRNA(Asn)/Glu-tRNA(Gln) amidotransferase A subunit family amidase